MDVLNSLLFSIIPAYAQNFEELSAETVFFMVVFVLAFPVISGVLAYYIARGILQGLTSSRKLSRKYRIINWASAVGIGLVVLVVMVYQIRLSV